MYTTTEIVAEIWTKDLAKVVATATKKRGFGHGQWTIDFISGNISPKLAISIAT